MGRLLRMPCSAISRILLSRIVEALNSKGCDCISLSGGIDTSLVAYVSKAVLGQDLVGFLAYYRRGVPRDIVYSAYLAKLLNIDLELIEIDDDYMCRAIPLLKPLAERGGHEDFIELRNDIVFYASIEAAKKHGCRCLYTGSGGDEVFAGYSFMYRELTEQELDEKTRRWALSGRYPEFEVARIVGLEVYSPYLDRRVLEVALEIPVDCLRSQIFEGKTILREILRDLGLELIASRIKTPAEAGAGTDILGSHFFDELIRRCTQ